MARLDLRIPHYEGELASQALGQVGAVGLVEVREHFGVTPAREPMTVAAKLVTELTVVVELTVLRSPNRVVFVGERLVPSLDVDDAEAPNTNRDTVGQVCAAIVRATMRHNVRHSLERFRRDDRTRIPFDLDHTTDAAHRKESRGSGLVVEHPVQGLEPGPLASVATGEVMQRCMTVAGKGPNRLLTVLGPSRRDGSDEPSSRAITLAIRTAAVLAIALAVAQIVDYGVFGLRVQALNSNTHASVFGAVSLVAEAVVVVAAFLLARRVRSREQVVLACALTVLFVMRLALPTHVVILSVPFIAIAFSVLWREGDNVTPRGLRVIRAGCLWLVASFIVHLAELALVMDPNSWAYQVRCVLKHDAELVGWILIAAGLLSVRADGPARLTRAEHNKSHHSRPEHPYPPRQIP